MVMTSKRKRESFPSEKNDEADLSYLKNNILSVCRLGTEEVSGRPQLSALKARIQRAYHPDEAAELLSFVTEREGDEAAFWAELVSKEQKGEPQPALDAGLPTLVRVLARAETERHIATRMLLREKKKSEREKHSQRRVHLFDRNGSAEKALEMIEALPQGSRGVQAPHSGFLNLGRKVAGDNASPEKQLGFGLLLEEYALELLRPSMPAAGMRCGEAASPLMDVSSNARGDVTRREAEMTARVLEAIRVGHGSGFAGRSRKNEPSQRRGGAHEEDNSSNEYSSGTE